MPSLYAPENIDDIYPDTSINHLNITQQCKTGRQWAVHEDPQLCALEEMIIDCWPDDITTVFLSAASILEQLLHLNGWRLSYPMRRGQPHSRLGERRCVVHNSWRPPWNHHVPASCLSILTYHQCQHPTHCWSLWNVSMLEARVAMQAPGTVLNTRES